MHAHGSCYASLVPNKFHIEKPFSAVLASWVACCAATTAAIDFPGEMICALWPVCCSAPPPLVVVAVGVAARKLRGTIVEFFLAGLRVCFSSC